MNLIVYVEPKDNEIQLCKEMAYVEGNKMLGKKYYTVDSNNLNISNPIHPSCTCKVVVISSMDEEGNVIDFSEEADLLVESEDEEIKKFADRYKQIERSLNKSTFKMPQGQAKPSRIRGWNEIIIESNIDILDSMTKNLKHYTYERLP